MDAIQSLDRFPARGRLVGAHSIREIIVPFGRSAYIIRYAETADREVVVLRVWHAREMRE